VSECNDPDCPECKAFHARMKAAMEKQSADEQVRDIAELLRLVSADEDYHLRKWQKRVKQEQHWWRRKP